MAVLSCDLSYYYCIIFPHGLLWRLSFIPSLCFFCLNASFLPMLYVDTVHPNGSNESCVSVAGTIPVTIRGKLNYPMGTLPDLRFIHS